MPNQTYALEWLNHANRNLQTARLLIRENHFTGDTNFTKIRMSRI